MARFQIEATFNVLGRNLFWISGNIIDGKIRREMIAVLPSVDEKDRLAPISVIDLVSTTTHTKVGLGLRYLDKPQLQAWQNLSLVGATIEITEASPRSTTVLYRPVGLKELELIAQTNFSAFPPRLPEQPIFYPVLTFEYAEQIAEDWNTKAAPFAGFVTRFEIDKQYSEKFAVHIVGNNTHQELWVPAEELTLFNQHIVGKIYIVAAYYGPGFEGKIDSKTNLPGGLLN